MVRIVTILILLLHCFSAAFSLDDFDEATLENPADFKIVVKNVGQGSCTIVKNEMNGKIIIVDAGSSSDAPPRLAERIAEELGEASCLADIPPFKGRITLLTSHSDRDHLNYFVRVFGKFSRLFPQIGEVFLGDHLSNYYRSKDVVQPTDTRKLNDSKTFLQYVVGNLASPETQATSLSHSIPLSLALLRSEPTVPKDDPYFPEETYQGYRTHIPLEDFVEPEQADRVSVEVLSANAGAQTSDLLDENANSAVVQVSINGKNIFIMGDATGLVTRRILKDATDKSKLEADLLVESHHGAESDGANNGLWLSIVKPKKVAISAGFYVDYFHPRVEPIFDLMVVDSLVSTAPHAFVLSSHEVKKNLAFITAQLAPGMTFKEVVAKTAEKPRKDEWLVFETEKAIFNTASSGDLAYTYNAEGEVVDFYREH
jgi:hypothetical protein